MGSLRGRIGEVEAAFAGRVVHRQGLLIGGHPVWRDECCSAVDRGEITVYGTFHAGAGGNVPSPLV